MATYGLSFPDNDSNMCGASDRLSDDVIGVPVCSACGYKTDIYFINPSFRVKRRVYDLSSSYDGYTIASLKFVEACKRLGLSGVEFLKLPEDPEFFVMKPTATTKFDFVSRNTKFESLCSVCGFYKEVSGAWPVFLHSEPDADISGTDVVFGSGNERCVVFVVTERAKRLLEAEKLRGIQFSEVMHN